MWVTPIAILFGFNHNIFPVISVNVVIALYVCMAMKEASDKHEPDEKFLAEARASINRPTREADGASPSHKKNELGLNYERAQQAPNLLEIPRLFDEHTNWSEKCDQSGQYLFGALS